MPTQHLKRKSGDWQITCPSRESSWWRVTKFTSRGQEGWDDTSWALDWVPMAEEGAKKPPSEEQHQEDSLLLETDSEEMKARNKNTEKMKKPCRQGQDYEEACSCQCTSSCVWSSWSSCGKCRPKLNLNLQKAWRNPPPFPRLLPRVVDLQQQVQVKGSVGSLCPLLCFPMLMHVILMKVVTGRRAWGTTVLEYIFKFRTFGFHVKSMHLEFGAFCSWCPDVGFMFSLLVLNCFAHTRSMSLLGKVEILWAKRLGRSSMCPLALCTNLMQRQRPTALTEPKLISLLMLTEPFVRSLCCWQFWDWSPKWNSLQIHLLWLGVGLEKSVHVISELLPWHVVCFFVGPKGSIDKVPQILEEWTP